MLPLHSTLRVALLSVNTFPSTANAGSDKSSDRYKPCIDNIHQCVKVIYSGATPLLGSFTTNTAQLLYELNRTTMFFFKTILSALTVTSLMTMACWPRRQAGSQLRHLRLQVE